MAHLWFYLPFQICSVSILSSFDQFHSHNVSKMMLKCQNYWNFYDRWRRNITENHHYNNHKRYMSTMEYCCELFSRYLQKLNIFCSKAILTKNFIKFDICFNLYLLCNTREDKAYNVTFRNESIKNLPFLFCSKKMDLLTQIFLFIFWGHIIRTSFLTFYLKI